jgi:hypothetical protein
VKKSRSGQFFCNNSCRVAWTNRQRAGEKHPNWKSGESVYRDIILRSGRPAVCEHCGLNDERVLSVHHIDSDRANNRIENLSWLCHNCHYLVHHFPDEREAFMRRVAMRLAADSPMRTSFPAD